MALKNVDVWQVLIGQPLTVCAHLLPICSSYAVSVLATKAINWTEIWSRVQSLWPQATKVDMAVNQTSVPNTISTKHYKIVEHEAVHTCAGVFWVHQCGNFQQYVYKHIAHSIIIIPDSNAMKSPRSNAFCVAKQSLTFTAVVLVQLVQCQHAERHLGHNMQEGIRETTWRRLNVYAMSHLHQGSAARGLQIPGCLDNLPTCLVVV